MVHKSEAVKDFVTEQLSNGKIYCEANCSFSSNRIDYIFELHNTCYVGAKIAQLV
jgi:hypothetical protein